MSQKVNPQELIILHKEDYEYLKKAELMLCGRGRSKIDTIPTYDLNRFREEAWEDGFHWSAVNDTTIEEITANMKRSKAEFLTKEIEL